MGWTYLPNMDRKGLIKYLTGRENQSPNWRVLDYSARGNHLWQLVETATKDTGERRIVITLDLMQGDPGYGWGYKSMCESMEPFIYDCPLKFLKAAPVASARWREGVRQYHNIRARRAKIYKAAKPGDVIKIYGATIPSVRVTGRRGSSLLGEYGGQPVRVPQRFLWPDEIKLPPTPEEAARNVFLEMGLPCRVSARGLEDGSVHVLFRYADGRYEGWYMSSETYDGIPLGTPAVPDSYRRLGEIRPAPPEFDFGTHKATTKEVTLEQFLESCADRPEGLVSKTSA